MLGESIKNPFIPDNRLTRKITNGYLIPKTKFNGRCLKNCLFMEM